MIPLVTDISKQAWMCSLLFFKQKRGIFIKKKSKSAGIIKICSMIVLFNRKILLHTAELIH
jgi:hypothetical protein